MRLNQNCVLCFILFILFLTSGCQKKVEPRLVTSQNIMIRLKATNDLNPDNSGTPLSVRVRLYPLKDKKKVLEADFEKIVEEGDAYLKADLARDMEQKELTIFPGNEIAVGFKRNSEVSFIAVVAFFRNATGVSWRKVIDLNPLDATAKDHLEFQFTLDKNAIEIDQRLECDITEK